MPDPILLDTTERRDSMRPEHHLTMRLHMTRPYAVGRSGDTGRSGRTMFGPDKMERQGYA